MLIKNEKKLTKWRIELLNICQEEYKTTFFSEWHIMFSFLCNIYVDLVAKAEANMMQFASQIALGCLANRGSCKRRT